ncbi:hypothetical protein [Streptomyces sp. S.PB5]|uniref:hypothetical protein n=1 Tax=Streptomyces sp. S.PB5 TaxID=3020844 RepID=UPI0025B1C444|nr:hypothetical protein [Streptomyces sp. S.PB5]MDN3028168.1 hypothetical protein [Streptomyces sp. S.PB5]
MAAAMAGPAAAAEPGGQPFRGHEDEGSEGTAQGVEGEVIDIGDSPAPARICVSSIRKLTPAGPAGR